MKFAGLEDDCLYCEEKRDLKKELDLSKIKLDKIIWGIKEIINDVNCTEQDFIFKKKHKIKPLDLKGVVMRLKNLQEEL